MSSLTETAYYTRLSIKWGIIGLIGLYILKSLLTSAFEAWKLANPPPPPPPTVAFGKLPALKFPEQKRDPKLIFTLETIEGKPYLASTSAAVYFIPKPSPNLLSLTRAQQFAGRLNFRGEPTTSDHIIYNFRDVTLPGRSLDFNIITNNFELNYDYGSDLSVFGEKNAPAAAEAVMQARNFLQNFSLYSDAIANGAERITFLSLSGNNLIPTTSLSVADAIRVDLGRGDIENLKLYTSDPQDELIYFIFSGSPLQEKKTLKISYKFWPVELEQRATYPLKTAEEAWAELKNGGGFIAGYQTGTEAQNRITIRRLSLGFYYPDEYQQFLQPIYIFEGDPGFLGYVSAVSPDWVSQPSAK